MIDNSTLEKLEFPKILSYISKYSVTEAGKQKILTLKPNNEFKSILHQGTLVNQAKEVLINATTTTPLEYIPDLSEELARSKIDESLLSNNKIIEILKLAIMSRLLSKYLNENKEISPQLFESFKSIFVDKVFEHHIQRVIDEKGDVKENASKTLKEIRREIRNKKNDLVHSIEKIMKLLNEQDMVQEDYLTLRDGRMVIPIKAEHKRHLKGFIHSESSTGQTVYIEPEETLELNNDIVSLTFAERREIERLLKELTRLIGTVANELRDTQNKIAEIDSIIARAHYSTETIGSFPEMDNNKPFSIQEGRHPVLLKKLGRDNTVPLNISLEDENVIIITGPNAGGKTVVLKTIGLLSALVHSGIHIPVSPDSNFHFYDNILIDIGDEQSIEDDLSTFSSHLKNILYVLDNASSSSLVLLDEIGTGTDPSEGASLAAAVLIKLRDRDSTVFASTHHGSLKLIANDEDRFVNAAMEFDNESLSPTYNFKLGVPGSSYAFEIARRIGIDDNLLKSASTYIDADKHKIEEFLIEVEKKSLALEKKLTQLELENSQLAGLSNLYKKNLEKLEKEKKEILKKVKVDADDYLKNVNKSVEKIIKEIRESNASREVIKKSKKIISELKEENKNLFAPDSDLPNNKEELNIGDFVRLKDTSTTGKIFSLDSSKNRAVIQVGALKMKVNLNNLLHEKGSFSKPDSSTYKNYEIPSRDYLLDIRGEKPEEAEFEVIKFVDDSYVSGHQRIEILHGKGTGALKNTVKNILSNHEKVKDFYFAPIEAGGEGVTIIELL
jgi:DNA mismatch repair protein MutS2